MRNKGKSALRGSTVRRGSHDADLRLYRPERESNLYMGELRGHGPHAAEYSPRI